MAKRSFLTVVKKFLYQVTHWETWHWLVKYIPMIPFWIVHCLKARSPWFFTAANPTLTFGGYEGETKMEMYNHLPKGSYPKTIFIQISMPFSFVRDLIQSKGFTFPMAVKPDVGRMGLMFRRINSFADLERYHHAMKVDYILQEFVLYPVEVSVFYYRFPGAQKGTITGFVKKEHLSVTGDGISTLKKLMLDYPRIQFRLHEMMVKHEGKLNDVLPHGEQYILSEALNLSRGGKLISLEQEKDENLLRVFDNLSHGCNFYFGRYDIKCLSIEDLKKGKNFSILEYNGSGAEPHHVYGNGNSFIKAVNILLDHWNILYKISVENHKKGIPYWSFIKGLRHLKKAREHFQILRRSEFTTSTEKVGQENARKKEAVVHAYELTMDKTA